MTPRRHKSKIATAVRIALLSGSPWLAAHAGAPLPIPCAGGACGNGVTSFVTAGAASAATAGSKLTINQNTQSATLNWQSFNIAAGHTVQFVQPSTAAVALNQIWDSSPTQIFGALDANGHVFLINQNGIVFGAGAQINVGGLVASTLNAASTVATKGLQYPGSQGSPAFLPFTDANGNPLPSGNITVQQGANLQAADGGQIYMFASNITNLGTIQTPAGQTILAAGADIYLVESPVANTNLRGMYVEVQGSGMVTNGLASNSSATSPQQLVGQIIAHDGNISLAALAVNQYGRLNATTSVTENGSIYLEARNGGVPSAGDLPEASTGGTLVLGQNSDTEVTLDTTDPAETTDSVAQPKSTIEMSGNSVQMLQGSVARATSGVIDVSTAQNLGSITQADDGSRLYVAQGAVLDVSGASTTLPVNDNVISADLESGELADSPLQRGGPLQGQTIYFDVRAHGTNPDGSSWWGTPIADVTGEILGMERNVVERNLTGGTVNIQSQGDVILAPGSHINVSGGYTHYTGGYLDTSTLLTLWGQTVPIADANPNLPYAGVVNNASTTDDKWGVTQSYQTTPSYYSPGYVQGMDAGTLDLSARAFVLDSTVSANTVVGPYQTQPTTAQPTTTAGWSSSPWLQGSMYRPYDQVPEGATLLIGTPGGNEADLIVDNVTITPGEVLPGLRNADGSAFNPLIDPLPATFTTSALQPDLLNQFQNVSIYTDGKLIEPKGVALSLAAGGNFTAQAASIDIGGGIDVPAGTISLTAQPTYTDQSDPDTVLTLGSDASLTAVGAWVNESKALYPNGNTAPLYINGGTVSLAASNPSSTAEGAEMQLDNGSVIDVSGGAELTSSGTLDAGTGGSIIIDASTPHASNVTLSRTTLPAPKLHLGATLLGYGLDEGGTLTIGAPGICIAASNCSAAAPSILWLSPQFFNSGGFASYDITADQGGLAFAPGTVMQLVQENLALPAGYANVPNAAALVGLAAPVVLPLRVRGPIDLSMTLEYPVNNTENIGQNSVNVLEYNPSIPGLTLPAGDVISTDPGGSLSLATDTELDVEGTLTAPGGNISLTVSDAGIETTSPSYYPSQAIWLGADAVLDASGAARVFPNSVGSLTGTVLSGGTVSLTADAGDVELLPGSSIDVRGASGTIDIGPVGGGRSQAEQIASAGGAIDIAAAYGAVIGGTLMAEPGAAGEGANQTAGGSLSLVINPALSNVNSGLGSGIPSDYDIIVSPGLVPAVVAPGSAVPQGLQGEGLVSANALAREGFSQVSLQSYEGNVEFAGGATLSATTEIALDAETYSVDAGTTANVEAPYIEFGSSSTPWATPSQATSGSGVLNVSGSFIELYGTSSLVGVGTANFASIGDLRVRGIQGYSTADPAAVIAGALYADGTINLSAQQIYPTTLTQFVISADPSISGLSQAGSAPTSGAITVNGFQGANDDLLSAGGSLALVAASITQDGVLRAPFGTIELDANTLTLGAGSVTSTSADGLTIPFGETQAGSDWVYPLANSITTVYGTDGVAPPSQNIILNAQNVDIKGGTIDISGGGDLQAYEWIRGPGGEQDVLGSTTSFAIIPSLRTSVAPYDPLMSSGSTLQDGEAVYLAGGSGVPAGTYVLMPARYALLPGAYLVTPESGTAYRDMAPDQSFSAPDGGTIVAGYLTTLGTPFASSRWNGFEVTSASLFMNQAQYNLTGANKFFTTQQTAATEAAANVAVSAMRLPEDGGVLDLIAGNSLTLDGTLKTGAQTGARGAEVDISNSDIVVTGGGSANQSGGLVVSASSLNQLGAQTLLLGGENDDGTIDTTAQTITVMDGATLSAPQILLTAQNEISVQSGASIAAQGTAPSATAFTLTGSAPGGGAPNTDGDGAFLGVSAGSQIAITRDNALGSEGTLDLAAGSTVSAGKGSIYLDATNTIRTQGSIEATGGSLAVEAPQIALGNAPSNFTGAVLGSNVFGSGTLANLLLMLSNPQAGKSSGARPAIQVYSGTSVSAQNITIDAPGLEGDLTAGQTAALKASGTLSLGDSLSAAAIDEGSAPLTPSAGGGSGSLILSGSAIALGDNLTGASTVSPQQVSIDGFGSVALDARNAAGAAQDITLSTDSNLTVTASRVTSAAGVTATVEAGYSGANQPFNPQGSVELLSSGSPTASPVAAPAGGSLAVMGSSIEVGTDIDLPSGNVTLLAQSGGISVDSKGSIDVAGTAQQYDSVEVLTPGGNVSLAASGNIDLARGSGIDVSAATGGNGGSLSILAPAGTVVAQGTLSGSGEGSSIAVDAQSFDFDALSRAVGAGGFLGSQSYRLRVSDPSTGNGSVIVASGQSIDASNVMLEADSGYVEVDGAIDAAGESGGNVTLAAADGITLNGTIDAHADSAGGTGGAVELDLENPGSQLTLGTGSLINVSGGGPSEAAAGPGASAVYAGLGGTVLLRVPYDVNAAQGFGGVSLSGKIDGASSTALEVYQAFSPQPTDQAGDVDITSIDPGWQAYAQGIATSEAAEVAALVAPATAAAWNFTVQPGIEIDATGTITLDTPWSLSGWITSPTSTAPSFPGILTLRAAGGVTINQSLSDGFADSNTSDALPMQPSQSWSYRIVAGADLAAANPLAVVSSNPQDVTIGNAGSGAMVRTGTGFVDVMASGDFSLANADSVLYTAGIYGGKPPSAAAGGPCRGNACQGLPAYSTGGGNIRINVGGNIDGSPDVDQFVNYWLWRQGNQTIPTAWSVDFADFDQGVAALGGGNVTVRAGGDIVDFSASVPGIGVSSSLGGNVDVEDGGHLTVSAGGNILGGSYYVGLGTAALSAAGSVGKEGTDPNSNPSPLIGLGDASLSVTATGNLQLSDIVNPSLLNNGNSQSVQEYFLSTYGPTTSATLLSIGGNVSMDDEASAIQGQYAASFFGATVTPTPSDGVALLVLPPILDVYAAGGDVDISRSIALFPSSQGDLQVVAGQNVTVGGGAVPGASTTTLTVPDVNPATLPSIADPQSDTGGNAAPGLGGSGLSLLQEIANPFQYNPHSPTPLFDGVSSFDEDPVTIAAVNGSVMFPESAVAGLWSAKPVVVSAGEDVVDLNLIAQNLTPGDVTSVTAGRDVVYPESRTSQGGIAPDDIGIIVAGPGGLQVTAGRNVNLGTADGIITIGNTTVNTGAQPQGNPALPSMGAGVSVEAGVGYEAPQYTAFIQQYVQNSSDFDTETVSFVEQVTGQNNLTSGEAKLVFAGMPAAEQRTFVEELFLALLEKYGTEAAKSGDNADFAGAYAAIQQLFPGANPDLSKSQTDPYSGDISLYFSQIYTEAGGSIALLAPGGGVNAGLAEAPTSYGLSKPPQDLGIVAESTGDVSSFSYGDFEVNQSRVFSAAGGNILVWSTEGNIDAGRGSKTSLSAASPTVSYDDNGFATVTYYPPTSGSGIQALADVPGSTPGGVSLFAPHGVVNANEAGIVAGNLTIAATAVLGTNNISASGVVVGVPVQVTGLGAQALGAASSAAGAESSAQSSVDQTNRQEQKESPQASAALRWLDVFVLGFGEETCSANDLDCLKRQKHAQHQ
jgi:filamentous hemagglutinin